MRLRIAEGILLDAAHHVRIYRTRADIVHMDALGHELLGNALREACDCILRADICLHRGSRGVGACRGKDDNRAMLLLLEHRGGVLHEPHGGVDVQGIDLRELVCRLLGNRADLPFIACIGYDDIDCAEGFLCIFDECLDLIFLRCIDDEALCMVCISAGRRDEAVELLLAGGGEGELCAFFCKGMSDGRTDASGGAGREHDTVFTIQIHRDASLRRWIHAAWGVPSLAYAPDHVAAMNHYKAMDGVR